MRRKFCVQFSRLDVNPNCSPNKYRYNHYNATLSHKYRYKHYNATLSRNSIRIGINCHTNLKMILLSLSLALYLPSALFISFSLSPFSSLYIPLSISLQLSIFSSLYLLSYISLFHSLYLHSSSFSPFPYLYSSFSLPLSFTLSLYLHSFFSLSSLLLSPSICIPSYLSPSLYLIQLNKIVSSILKIFHTP